MTKLNQFHGTYGLINYTTEEGTKNALIQLAIFYVYLICLTLVGNALTTHHQHYFIRGMRQLLLRTLYMNNSMVISFNQVITIPDFWNYLEYMVLPTLHGVVYDETVDWEPLWVNNRPNLYGRLFLNESLLLGAPRLRQIRVRDDTCYVHFAFARYYNTCMSYYSKDNEFTEPFYKGTEYKTMRELQATPIKGLINTYASGGYVQGLSFKKDVNLGVIRHLRKIKWLDRGSRLVLFELNMINLNLDLLQAIKLIFEIMPTGLINAIYESRSNYTDPMLTSSGWLIIGCAGAIYIINFYYTFVELKKLYLNGYKNYFTRLSIFLNLPRIIIVYMSLIYTLFMFSHQAQQTYSIINSANLSFVSLDYVSLTYSLHRDAIGILVFFSWISLMSFMNFNPVLRTMGIAMRMAATDLGAFAIMFLIAFVAYGNLGLLLFGGENVNFKDFPTAFITMVRMLVADFDYFELERESRLLGPIFFLTYVLLIFFVLLNMFLAAIVLSYRTATSTVAFKPSFLWFYIRKQLYRLSNGCISAPRYPEWAVGHDVDHSFDERKLEQLSMRKEYTAIEADLNILLSRLDLIENLFYCLHNNIGDIIFKAKEEITQRKKKKPNRT